MNKLFEGSYLGDGSKLEDDTRLECGICWWVYDPALGDDETQTPPGTPFRLLPDTWECPNCAASKSKFMVIDSATLSEDDAVNNLANAYRRAALKVKGMWRCMMKNPWCGNRDQNHTSSTPNRGDY